MSRKPFSMDYRTYDTRQGFGTARQWRGAFTERMRLDEAEAFVKDRKLTPWDVLGLKPGATAAQLKAAYREKALACHPDRCAVHGLTLEAATEQFKRLLAAYTVLAGRYDVGGRWT